MPDLNRVLRPLKGGAGWMDRRFRTRAAVLMYHGVGDVGIDPWGLFVSPSNFSEHLDVLQHVAKPMPLLELGLACGTGALEAGSVAVTIDDGYANILHEAKPRLERSSVPATVFVISEPVTAASEYWWDELAGYILTPGDLPPIIDLAGCDLAGPRSAGDDWVVELGAATRYTAEQWRADHRYRDEEGTPSPRMALYRTLWQQLMALDDANRRSMLDELAAWTGVEMTPRASHRSVSQEELIELDGGPISVGGHTATHPLLPELPPERQRFEIGENKRHLEAVLDRPVDAFSYPFGAHDPSSVATARDAGYHLAVTTRPRTITTTVDRHRIGRFDVKNWTGEEFERRLRRWMWFH